MVIDNVNEDVYVHLKFIITFSFVLRQVSFLRLNYPRYILNLVMETNRDVQ